VRWRAGRPRGRCGTRPGRIRAGTADPPEVPLPLWLTILLGVFWLAVLVTVAFTVWRLVGNLKALAVSVQELSERLTPVLEELADAGQETADHAARLSDRGAKAAGQDQRAAARPRRPR
jgi:hypothetical protein